MSGWKKAKGATETGDVKAPEKKPKEKKKPKEEAKPSYPANETFIHPKRSSALHAGGRFIILLPS